MQFILKLFIVLIPVAMFLLYSSRMKNKYLSILTVLFLLSFSAIVVFRVGNEIYINYHQPPEWDFLVFWLDGKAALTGGNFYDAKTYQGILLPYNPSDGFRQEIIDVGFKYPPFTMFLFLPLGLLDISHSYLLWQILNLLLCALCIYTLWSIFLKNYGILSLSLIAALMLMLSPVRSTFYFAQTIFLVLLFFLLFWKNRSTRWGGVWLALCVVVKPFMALLYIYPLLTKKWRMLALAVSTLLILTLLSVIVFGLDVFVSFFNNPVSKVPGWLYTEMVNQSLLATILRLNTGEIIEGSPILNPLYLGISLLLTLITTWVTVKKNNSQDWVILSILFLALIVYPASLMPYGVFLIVPMVLLLRQSSRNIKKQITILLSIFAAYFLSGYDSGNYSFFANLFIWIVCIILGAKSNLEKTSVSDSIVLAAAS